LELATALGLVVIGAVIQGSIGFGLAAVVAPVLLLVNPIFLPGPMLFTSMLLTTLVGHRDRRHIHWPEVSIATVGRVLGMLPAALAIRYLSATAYDLLFSCAVLFGVVVSLAGWHFRLTLRNLFIAATGSGFVSTVSAIGGPPLALVYQHAEAPKIRGTMSAIFTIGTPISLAGLWWAGRFGWAEFTLGVLLMPAILVGFYLSRYTAGRLSPRTTRPAVLALAAATALVVMIRALIASL
jgi:uncharacterized membrane protein YfcA